MLFTVADVLGYEARTQEDGLKIREIFLDRLSGDIPYIALDIGGWFDATSAIVAADKFGMPDIHTREWLVELDRDEVAAQPHWEEEGWFDWLFGSGAPAHLFVGPHGTGYDPMLLAQIEEKRKGTDGTSNATEERRKSDGQAPVDAESRISGLIPLSELLGRDVAGSDGHVGHLGDALFDAEIMRVTHMVIDNEELFRDRRYVIDYGKLQIPDDDEGDLQVGVTQEILEAGPTQTEMTNVRHSTAMVAPGFYFPLGY